MAYKPCNRCGQDIGFRKEGNRTLPVNPDGTPHHCNPQPATPAEKENSTIGIYQGLAFKRINIVRKDKKILSSGVTPSLLNTLAAHDCPIKTGMKVKVIFAKDGNADKIEICPDQPALIEEQPAAKPAVAEPEPATVAQQETRTSPDSIAPATTKAPQTFTPGDLFSPKDRLIVAQCLVKAYTDLWMQTHTPDTITFAAARNEILGAVEADLPRVMKAGVR